MPNNLNSNPCSSIEVFISPILFRGGVRNVDAVRLTLFQPERFRDARALRSRPGRDRCRQPRRVDPLERGPDGRRRPLQLRRLGLGRRRRRRGAEVQRQRRATLLHRCRNLLGAEDGSLGDGRHERRKLVPDADADVEVAAAEFDALPTRVRNVERASLTHDVAGAADAKKRFK